MNKILWAALPVALLLSANSVADSDISTIKPKIVGGEVSTEGAWPWMSALVYTFQGVTTSLSVDGVNYESQSFTYGPEGDVSGELTDCGIGDNTCSDATDKVCLIERGDINFSVKADNCQSGGGVGVIVYNNVDGIISGTLGEEFAGAIPVVAITKTDGATLKTKLGLNASINVVNDSLSQSSSCGASFLGDKWVLTASHCVDGNQASSIKINVGEYDLSNGAENAIAVKRIYMHSDYNDVSFDNDLALLELVESVDNEAITLVGPEELDQSAIDNVTATVMGWGGRVGYEPNDGPTSDFPDVLHQVDLQLMTNQQCQSTLGEGYRITNGMICAYVDTGGKGSCQGDSGGPLIINTNEGWQQVGIVSWGIGCAAQGYPGVYTRTANFIGWINSIMSGIAIEQNHDFGVTAQDSSQSYQLNIVNNTSLDANLNFSVQGDDLFTLVSDNCLVLASGAECQLTVNYSAAEADSHSATIIISSDNTELAVSSAKVEGLTIAPSQIIATQLGSDDSVMKWYSGGDASWLASSSASHIQSGNINDNQESIAMINLSGEGELAFEWSVSSEENVDDPADPFDALYLYIDGNLIDFISGDVEFKSENISLSSGDHSITWIYKKDAGTKDFKDKAYLRNVVFTPVGGSVTTPPVVIKPTNPNARSSSGGGMAWLSLILISLMNVRRR
jgi:secreted trypsin-like serine protease